MVCRKTGQIDKADLSEMHCGGGGEHQREAQLTRQLQGHLIQANQSIEMDAAEGSDWIGGVKGWRSAATGFARRSL